VWVDIEGGYRDVIGILWTAWTVYVGDFQGGSWALKTYV